MTKQPQAWLTTYTLFFVIICFHSPFNHPPFDFELDNSSAALPPSPPCTVATPFSSLVPLVDLHPRVAIHHRQCACLSPCPVCAAFPACRDHRIHIRHCHSMQVCHCSGASRLKVLQSWNLPLNSCLLAPYLGSIVLGPASSMRPWLVVHTALKMPRYTIHSTMVAVPMAAATIWWCADRTVLLPLDSRGGCCRRCH